MRLFSIIILSCLCFGVLAPVVAYAVDLSPFEPLVLTFVKEYPKTATILLFMAGMRSWAKPIGSLIKRLIYFTNTKADDTFLEKLEKNPWWRGFAYLIDWLTSIKLESKNKIDEKTIADYKAHN